MYPHCFHSAEQKEDPFGATTSLKYVSLVLAFSMKGVLHFSAWDLATLVS